MIDCVALITHSPNVVVASLLRVQTKHVPFGIEGQGDESVFTDRRLFAVNLATGVDDATDFVRAVLATEVDERAVAARLDTIKLDERSMKSMSLTAQLVLTLAVFACGSSATAQPVLERLGRSVVAIPRVDDGVFISWRLLGNEPPDVGFDIFRQTDGGELEKLNERPLTGPTHFQDSLRDRSQTVRYHVRPRLKDAGPIVEGTFQLPADAPARDYLAIPLQTPEGYHAGDASVGDLDGDGAYEIVVHMVGRGRDNSQSGLTSEPILHAYKLDGTLLWKIRLGKNIREGAHYTQFIVYDLDSDGKAEVVCKTADGTIDGLGNVIGDAAADHRQLPAESAASQASREERSNRPRYGYILRGPEFLTVFAGSTGAALGTVDFVPPRHPDTNSPSPTQMKKLWGDNYGNRIDRFLACVAYLDGQQPSLIMCRGYYTRSVLVAWDWRDGELSQRWVFDSDQLERKFHHATWSGQGNHSVAVADVDQDGRDEIVYGAMVVDDDGSGLYSTGLGHGDAQHTSDLDPSRDGLETWSIHEHPPADRPGVELRDAGTGEILFADAYGRDVARGMAADIDPRYAGCELWGGTRNLFDVKGNDIGPRPRSQNMAIWWDGDRLRELLDGVDILKWDYREGRETRIFAGRSRGLSSNNGSKSNPCLVADLLGDWREELVARTEDSRELRIYTTTISTPHRLQTLMHDPVYRMSIAWQNVGYNQPPHPGFFLGVGMESKDRPPIRVVGGQVDAGRTQQTPPADTPPAAETRRKMPR